MRIFKYLMLGLLATSAMVPAINAATETKDDASVVRRVFLYDAPACNAEKELYFNFKKLFSSVCKEMGTKIEGLQENLLWKPREGVLPTMHDGFQQALTQGIAQLHVALDATPRLDRARVLGLFDALAARESQIYERLFEQADELIGYLNTTTLSTPSGTGNYAYYNGCSIPISSTNSEQQFQYLNLAHQLSFESLRLKVFNPSLIETNQAYWSLLAYLMNSNEVRPTNGTCYPVKQEVLDVFHAYGQGLDPRAAEYKFLETMLEDKNYTYGPLLHFDLAEARGIAAIMADGNSPPPYTSQPPIVIKKEAILYAAKVEGWNRPVVPYVPTEGVVDSLVQAVQKMAVEDMPPPPRVIELFSPQAKQVFEEVKDALNALHTAQEAAYAKAPSGKKYDGWSRAEQIMAYADDSVISPAFRANISRLLIDQLGLRGIVIPNILTVEKIGSASGRDAAASYMSDWIRERITKDGLAVNVGQTLTGMDYLKERAARYDDSQRYLFNTMWALRAVSMHYDALTEEQVGKQVKGEIQSLLAQSFGMIIEHNGRCATGAKGRDFLMQFNMVRLFMDYHPTTLA